MLMGEVHQHLLPRRVSTDSAITHFRRAALDPGFMPPLIHLAEHEIRQGRIREAARLRKLLDANGGNAEARSDLDTMSECVQRGPDAVDFVALARSNPKLVYEVATLLAPGAQQTVCVRAAFEALLITDAWSTSRSWAAAQALQGLLVARGDVDQATTFLMSLVQSGAQAQNPLLQNAAVGSLFQAALNSMAGASMTTLTARTEEVSREQYGPAYERIRGVTAPWLLGNWYAHKKDRQLVLNLRDFLLASAQQPQNPRAADAAARAAALSAHLLLLDGDTVAAINAFDRIASTARTDAVYGDLAASMAPERLILAQLYLARRDYRAAHDVAAGFDHPSVPTYPAYVPLSLQIRRHAARALGDDRLAEQYTRRLRALGREDLITTAR
jgi:hypothetical protein